jgi:prepilin-type processing-associated H-X9-DG protein
MYSNVYEEQFPDKTGKTGLQVLATEGFLEATKVYVCPSTTDKVVATDDISANTSYCYAGGLSEATSIASGLAADDRDNHDKYGNILFVDGHVKGYAGTNWSASRGKTGFAGF